VQLVSALFLNIISDSFQAQSQGYGSQHFGYR